MSHIFIIGLEITKLIIENISKSVSQIIQSKALMLNVVDILLVGTTHIFYLQQL